MSIVSGEIIADSDETIDDIVAEMRQLSPEKFLVTPWFCEPLPSRLRSYSDRIEAALKREKEKIGNAAAMRDALEEVRFYLPHFLQYMRLHWEDAEAGGYYGRILEVVNAALSAHPRNCDRYKTEEEALSSFQKMCDKHECTTCPFEYGRSKAFSCHFNWLYEEAKGETGESK